MDNNILTKLVVILGPTAAGKTEWSLDIAEEMGGEIISADSRQVYKYMDIGTAKAEGKIEWFLSPEGQPQRRFMSRGIPHYLIDWIYPDEDFNLAFFQSAAKEYISLISDRGRIPLMVGGTGLYIQSIVDNYNLPGVGKVMNLRKSLQDMNLEDLIDILEMVDPQSRNEIDLNNKRRIIRAIEVSTSKGKPFSKVKSKGDKLYNTLQIGVKIRREKLYERINKRVEKMFEEGLKEEVERLLDMGYDWDFSSMKGIGYREFRSYFQQTATIEEVKEKIKSDTRAYARRQLSWFRRDDRIKWCDDLKEAKTKIKRFLN